MNNIRLLARRLFDGHNYIDNQVLTIANGIITAIDNDTSSVDKTLAGLVVPGYIDLQVNGGGGVLFNASPSLSGIRTIMTAHAKFGTTAMLPTLISDTVETMECAADAIALAIANNEPGIIGVHFEGPHLSVAKKGAHSEAFIREISPQEWQVLERKDLGQVVVTLAPETVVLSDIERMVSAGIRVCLGHTNASYKLAQQAVDHGASGFTHLFNAMSPIQGREPGVTGCALLSDASYCGVIVDGHHVDYANCRLAVKTKPAGKVFLVTDAMPPVGTNEQEFAFFDRQVKLNAGKLTSTTGELAGSVLSMAAAVSNAHQQLNISLDEAIRMATTYPASYIEDALRGTIGVGKQADFIVLDEHLSVQATWIGGKEVYRN
jgi:N-acetylglucosamine-6-phosphate deacetylase